MKIIGINEVHGAYAESMSHPPSGVIYKPMDYKRVNHPLLKSPIKGYLSSFYENEVSLIESVISPVFTDKPWLYSLACFQEAMAFNFLNFPLPKTIRKMIISNALKQDNCKRLIFWSKWGRNTLSTYGNVTNPKIQNKSIVVYPAVGDYKVNRRTLKEGAVTFLFSGDFFRKGGANVVDVFRKISELEPNIKLLLCCSLDIDFNTPNNLLRSKYLNIIENHAQIQLIGRVPRDVFISQIIPQVDVYLLPSYNEAFGFAVLEAMSFGLPVISTNIMAFPEMIKHEVNGFMVDISKFNVEELFSGYTVNDIPGSFFNEINEQLYQFMSLLINSPRLLRSMGESAKEISLSKFSIDKRNEIILDIYSSL